MLLPILCQYKMRALQSESLPEADPDSVIESEPARPAAGAEGSFLGAKRE
jgi:hypothetical protein